VNYNGYFIGAVCVLIAWCALAEEDEKSRDWIASIYGGLDYSSGNTEETAYKYGADYEKKNGSVYRYKFRIDGKYRKTEGDVTDSKIEADGEARRIFGSTKRWFALAALSALHDDIRDITYRVKGGPNIGCYLKDTETLTADVSSGLLYVREKTPEKVEDYLAWRLAQWFTWDFSETARWWFGTEVFTDIGNFDDYNIRFFTAVESRINSHFSLIVALEDTYDNQPEEDDDIEKNDLEIGVGLRYTF